MAGILVGTSSWADRSMISSGWYPREVNTPAGRLAWYAAHFPLVEVDTTFHAIPAPETALGWVARTPDRFTFDVTAFSLLTGQATPVAALPADLRPATGRTVQRKDLPTTTVDTVWDRFHAFLHPLAAAGKLGVVLLRFPGWFACGEGARRRIADTADRCRPYRVAVDLPHRSWVHDPARALETLRFLQARGLSFCCVDGPGAPPIVVATAEPAMMRFDGHHRHRTDDPYPEGELRDRAGKLRLLEAEVGETHALLNNCCGARAPRDAARLAELLASGVEPARH